MARVAPEPNFETWWPTYSHRLQPRPPRSAAAGPQATAGAASFAVSTVAVAEQDGVVGMSVGYPDDDGAGGGNDPVEGASGLSEEVILRSRRAEPSGGWRAQLCHLTGGRVNPGPSRA